MDTSSCGVDADAAVTGNSVTERAGTEPFVSSPFISSFGVAGMTCGHCVRSVKGELAKLDGVTDVAVDFRSGTVQVTSTAAIDADALRAAVDEAGYEYVG